MFTTILVVIGLLTLSKWLLTALFPRTVLRIRLALFAAAFARLMQQQAERMQQDTPDQPKP